MRITMKNDLDLIRAILEEVEGWASNEGKMVELAGWPIALVARHVERLCDDGLLDYRTKVPDISEGITFTLVTDMSTKGHEFLGALRSGDVLERIKASLKPSELASLSFGKLAGIAGELAERAIRKKLGLD